MSSELDICNLALSHLGDVSNVSSIDPPEGSAQSILCARFYPLARNTMIEMHNWSFATKKIQLAQVENSNAQWEYAYAVPNDMISALSIIDPNVGDDYTTNALNYDGYTVPIYAGTYSPEKYAIESDQAGNLRIFTNIEDAVLRYQARITDTNKFSALFVNALSWHLSSMLAGPIIKGDQGAAESKRCAQMMAIYITQAIQFDTNQRKIKPDHVVAWVAGR